METGSWLECSNPLGKRVIHIHFFEVGTIYYPNKICPMCWRECLVLERYNAAPVMAITSRFGHSKNRHANKQQCGTDTL